MRTRLFSILTLAAVLAVPPLALAGPADHGRGGHGPEARMDRMFDLLDLDDGQKDQLQQMFSEHRATAPDRHETLGAARRALHERIQAVAFDEAAIRDAAAELAKIEADLAVERAAMLQQVRRVLNPGQFELFQELHGHRMGMMHDGPGQTRGMHKRLHHSGH